MYIVQGCILRVAAPITSNNVCVTQRYSLLLCYAASRSQDPSSGQTPGPRTRSQHYPQRGQYRDRE